MGFLIDQSRADKADEAPHRCSCEAKDGFHIGDHDPTNHGSKHHREGEDFKPEWGHVASCSKGSIFLLLLKQQCVQGLPARQNHHGEAHSHRHHEAHSDHLCHRVGGEVDQHIACGGISEADVTKKPHHDIEGGDHVEGGGKDGAHGLH